MGRRYKIPELGFDEALGPQFIEEGWKWDCAAVAFLPNLQQKRKRQCEKCLGESLFRWATFH